MQNENRSCRCVAATEKIDRQAGYSALYMLQEKEILEYGCTCDLSSKVGWRSVSESEALLQPQNKDEGNWVAAKFISISLCWLMIVA